MTTNCGRHDPTCRWSPCCPHRRSGTWTTHRSVSTGVDLQPTTMNHDSWPPPPAGICGTVAEGSSKIWYHRLCLRGGPYHPAWTPGVRETVHMPPQNKRGTPNGNDASHAQPRAASPVAVSWRARRLLWSIVQATAYRYSFHTWSDWRAFLLRRFGARIGRHCTIRRSSRVYYPWLLEMADFACLGDNVAVCAASTGRLVRSCAS